VRRSLTHRPCSYSKDANRTTQPRIVTPTRIGPPGCSTSSSSHVGCPADGNDYPSTTHSAPSPSVEAPNNGPQSVSTTQYSGLQPFILRATAISSPSVLSARNRRYGQTTSIAPVPVQGSMLVANAPDPRLALPSIPVVSVSEPTADQPTIAPEEQHTIQESTLIPTEYDPRRPPPTIHRIRIGRLLWLRCNPPHR
jgi:hypothetical protein